MIKGLLGMEVSVTCDSCGKNFNLTDCMFERKLNNNLMLTILTCSNCHKEMVVQIDNLQTLKLHQRLLNVLRRTGVTKARSGEATPSQKRRQEELTTVLAEKRLDLQNKYNHTLYQFEGKEYQLDIHVPNMKLSEEI